MHGARQIRIGRAIHCAILDPARARNADHLRAIGASVSDVDRRPGGARARSAADQPLVAVDQRRHDRRQRPRMMQHAAHEPARQSAKGPARRFASRNRFAPGFRIRQAHMNVRAVAGQMREWLGHECRPQTVLLGHRSHHPLEKRVPVRRGQRVRILPIDLELAVGVFVIVGVRAPNPAPACSGSASSSRPGCGRARACRSRACPSVSSGSQGSYRRVGFFFSSMNSGSTPTLKM